MALYLLHFDRPYKHARHYLGWSADVASLQRRVEAHAAASLGYGKNHKLMIAARAAGISFIVSRIWPHGTRADEKRKKQRGHARHCPICRAEAKVGTPPL